MFSNGTEYGIFMENNCLRCEYYVAWDQATEDNPVCPIEDRMAMATFDETVFPSEELLWNDKKTQIVGCRKFKISESVESDVASLNYEGIPAHIRGSMKRYIEDRIPPGGFLTAVLCNDLRESFARADHINRQRVFDIVSWLYNEAPSDCWGSPMEVELWLRGRNKG